jgi:hypothetical protein
VVNRLVTAAHLSEPDVGAKQVGVQVGIRHELAVPLRGRLQFHCLGVIGRTGLVALPVGRYQ